MHLLAAFSRTPSRTPAGLQLDPAGPQPEAPLLAPPTSRAPRAPRPSYDAPCQSCLTPHAIVHNAVQVAAAKVAAGASAARATKVNKVNSMAKVRSCDVCMFPMLHVSHVAPCRYVATSCHILPCFHDVMFS